MDISLFDFNLSQNAPTLLPEESPSRGFDLPQVASQFFPAETPRSFSASNMLISSRPALFETNPDLRVNPLWRPGDWQFALSTHVLASDNMAGFYEGGVHADGISSNGDGIYSTGVSGFSSASGDPPVTLEASFVRKRSTGVHPGEYQTLGPSFVSKLSYQNNQFTDYGWRLNLSDAQLREIVGETASEMADGFDPNAPAPTEVDSTDAVSQYGDEVQQWANSNEAGINNIPSILSHMFDSYDPSKDYSTKSTQSRPYGVPTFRADEMLCLESTVTRYDRRINVFNGGKICLEGSALFFGGNHFDSNLYLGAGPYAEWNLLSYHQKPFRSVQSFGLDPQAEFVPPSLTLSTFLYADMQYYNGFDFENGFDDSNRFVTARLGIGLRSTLPSFSRNVR